MKHLMQAKAAVYALIMALFFAIISIGCEKNEKLPFTDEDIDGDFDQAEIELEGEGETGEDIPLLTLEKWHTAYNGIPLVANDGVVWLVSLAGLLAFDTAGTINERSDDAFISHNENTLDIWPSDPIETACIDGAGGLWFATGRDLYYFNPAATPMDKSDDGVLHLNETIAVSSVLTLLCLDEGAGAWVVAGGGFVAAIPDGSNDPSAWTINDYQTQSTELTGAPYAADKDAEGRLWMTNFIDGAYVLYAVETGDVADGGDDMAHQIPIGLEGFAPASLAADSDSGLWILGEKGVVHFDHGGTLDNAEDDVWLSMPESGRPYGDFLPLAKGEGIAFDQNGQAMIYMNVGQASAGDEIAIEMEDIGTSADISRDNVLVGMSYSAADGGLWYSATNDFGFLSIGDDIQTESWTQTRIVGVGGVPDNDIDAFHASDEGVSIGGANGFVTITKGEGDSVSIADYRLINPEDVAPFAVKAFHPIGDGMLVGGTWLVYIDEAGEANFWGKRGVQKYVTDITEGPDNYLWINSVQRSIVDIISFRIYTYAGTPANGDDDNWVDIDTDYFGKRQRLSADDVAFFDGCKALIGNSVGLHYYDCNGTPLETGDDIVASGLLDRTAKYVRQLEYVGENGFWMMTIEGLFFFDSAGTPEIDDDELIVYERDNPSYYFAVDEMGKLYYFIEGGLLIHDPMGTPKDPSDDEGHLIPLMSKRSARVYLDAEGAMWYSYGDGSGIYHGSFNKEAEMLPIEEAMTPPEEETE